MGLWPYLGLLVPLAPFIVGGLAIWTRHQRQMLEMQSKIAAERAAQYASDKGDLEERMRVLERIITDKGYDVATQIEALRDTRRVDELIEHHSGKEPTR